MPISIFSDLLSKVADMTASITQDTVTEKTIIERCHDLMTSNSEAANLVRAQRIMSLYKSLDIEEKKQFFLDVEKEFGIDDTALEHAIEQWTTHKNSLASRHLHFATEPVSQNLLRTLNYAPNATLELVNMRTDLLKFIKDNPELQALDKDFLHLFQSWFNRGFLELEQVNWSTSAEILEKLIAYEAVHEIQGWDDLRQRVADVDRGLYAYFHPALGNEPLIFVQVALMTDIPSSVSSILHAEREHIDPRDANTAVFYSISNCQDGLRGISFGNFLIKQVVENIRHEFPKLENFVTLSPIPGFKKWATQQLDNPDTILEAKELNMIEDLSLTEKSHSIITAVENADGLQNIVAKYLVVARSPKGEASDPVARFHLGNGAQLHNIHILADTTENGLQNAWGCMVNYKYNIAHIERNHDQYYNHRIIAISDTVSQMVNYE